MKVKEKYIDTKSDELQIRTYKRIPVEIRADEATGEKILRGLIPYNKKSVDMGFYEVIKPSAFRKTLADKSQVFALRNHNTDQILGNTKSGTLRLTDSDEGLICECSLPQAGYAQDLAESVSRGDVQTMSFGFYAIKDHVSVDENGDYLRELYEVQLFEVSFGVVFPAYEDTTSEVRKQNRDYIEKRIAEAEQQEPSDDTPQGDSDESQAVKRRLKFRAVQIKARAKSPEEKRG